MKRLRYALRAFITIMLKRDHVYADPNIISYEGGDIRVCNLMNDALSSMKDELEQDKVINQVQELLCKSAN